ncbi:O-antigen ligase family protein [Novosphingobium sp.]|uniref:O-antigen ligase family protein n=1 Tax=Novosphingobium sp. TaxID=1874826 RepID=UPI00286DA929|nr:O-antigen ligase family protein [Novosphingobium sp.]
MPKVSKDNCAGLAESGKAVSAKKRTSSVFSGWFWTVLIALMIAWGGTNIAYPLMRTLSGAFGAIVFAAALTSRTSRWTRPNPSDFILAGIVVLFVIQLIPLPPQLWTLLGGRDAIAAIDREVFGHLLWRPLSIHTEATWQTFAFLIPFLGTYLAYRSGDEARRSAMMRGVAIGFVWAVALGLLQVAGLDFLHPYPIEADNQFGNGFFTNHNHQATLVLMAAVLLAWHGPTAGKGSINGKLAGLAVAAAMATVASGSRAGFVLMAGTGLAIGLFWLVTRPRSAGTQKPSLRPFAWALGAAAVLSAIISAMVIGAERYTLGRGGLMEDQRFELAPIAWRAIWQFWPTGSGFGTFQTPYRQVEPIEALRFLDVTHAHNDLLEALIEGGLPALVLIVALSLRILMLTGRALRSRQADSLATAATGLALAIPLVHSLVDYPLRTMAISVLFAVAIASLEARAGFTRITNA